MGRPSRANRQDTRALALLQASALLHSRGYLGVSMDEVARAIGVRKSTLYHHFPGGKEQMVLEIAMDVMKDFETRLMAALHGKTQVAECLSALVQWRLEGPLGTERRVREAAGYMSPDSQQQIFAALMGQLITPIQRVFIEGVHRGELRPHNTRLVSAAFISVLSELGELGEGDQKPTISESEVQDVVQLFLQGVGA